MTVHGVAQPVREVVVQALRGDDGAAAAGRGQRQARPYDFTVHDDVAGAADTVFASQVHGRGAGLFAQAVRQAGIGFHGQRQGLAVDVDVDVDVGVGVDVSVSRRVSVMMVRLPCLFDGAYKIHRVPVDGGGGARRAASARFLPGPGPAARPRRDGRRPAGPRTAASGRDRPLPRQSSTTRGPMRGAARLRTPSRIRRRGASAWRGPRR